MVEIKTIKSDPINFEGNEVLTLVDNNINVYLYGEAGTGKTTLAMETAKKLNLELHIQPQVTQEHQLMGFRNAKGDYIETPLYKAYKNGGLFYIDEIDASIPEALITVNMCLANDWADFCGIKVHKHKDFRCIVSGNTFGSKYSSSAYQRQNLDAATLDRFYGVEVNYNLELELQILNGDMDTLKYINKIRQIKNELGIVDFVLSTRTVQKIAQLQEVFSLNEIIFNNCSKETEELIKGKL